MLLHLFAVLPGKAYGTLLTILLIPEKALQLEDNLIILEKLQALKNYFLTDLQNKSGIISKLL